MRKKNEVIIVQPVTQTVYYSEDGRRSFGAMTAYSRTARFRMRNLISCEGHYSEPNSYNQDGCGPEYTGTCDGRCNWEPGEYVKIVKRYARLLRAKDRAMGPEQKEIKRLLKIKS